MYLNKLRIMNELSLKNWGTRSSHVQIVFTLGCILIVIAILNYGIQLYTQSILNSEDGGYFKYAAFYEKHRISLIIAYFIDQIARCSFYIGIVPLLFSTKRWIVIAIVAILVLVYNVFNFFSPETFELYFSVERYKVSSFVLSAFISVSLFVVFLLFFFSARNKTTKMGSLFWLIAQSIAFIILITYAVLFSMDSTYFTENNKTFIDVVRIYNQYISGIIFLLGTILITYEVHKLDIS